MKLTISLQPVDNTETMGLFEEVAVRLRGTDKVFRLPLWGLNKDKAIVVQALDIYGFFSWKLPYRLYS